MTKRILSSLMFGLMIVGVACGRGRAGSADTTLNRDLSLAAQQRGSLDSLADAARLQSSTRATTTRRLASSSDVSHTRRSSGGSSSAGTVASSAPTGGRVEKHTNRDAAIGAAAGAVIGATTSKNKVKGGLIGGVVGGILGGVIGNNVDKKKKP